MTRLCYVHPAIIVGRLQHKKMLSFAAGTEFFEKIELFD